MHVLIVDDEPDIRYTTRVLLETMGHSVDVACNGAKAVEIASARRPDAILLDLQMPVMDGLTATRRLCELFMHDLPRIIVVSAYVREREWRDRALAAGAHECLTKPSDVPSLTSALGRAIT